MDGTQLPEGTFAAVVAGDYRALFEQTAIPVALVSARGNPHFVSLSRGFLDAFDLRRPLIGCPLDEVLTPRSSGDLIAAMSRCIGTSESVRVDVALLGGGVRRHTGMAVHDARASGFPGHVILEAEGRRHAVHSSEQRLTALFDRIGGDGLSMSYIHDLKSERVRYADGGLAQRLGFSGGSTILGAVLALMHPDDASAYTVYVGTRGTLADDEFVTQTVRLKDVKGDWLLVSFRSRVLRRSRDGAPRLMIGSATDITGYAAAAVEATVSRAEENERARIGRELHDSTAQYLVAADLGLTRVLMSKDLSPQERSRLLGVQSSLATAQAEMRAFAYFLHPPELRELGLQRTLQKFCAGFARRSGLQMAFAATNVPPDVPSDVEHALFRVGQEALMNVYRHAFARRVSVSLRGERGRLTLEVRDDGIGVDSLGRFEQGGMGMAGMRSRMVTVGGELTVDHLGPGLAVVAGVSLSRSGAVAN